MPLRLGSRCDIAKVFLRKPAPFHQDQPRRGPSNRVGKLAAILQKIRPHEPPGINQKKLNRPFQRWHGQTPRESRRKVALLQGFQPLTSHRRETHQPTSTCRRVKDLTSLDQPLNPVRLLHPHLLPPAKKRLRIDRIQSNPGERSRVPPTILLLVVKESVHPMQRAVERRHISRARSFPDLQTLVNVQAPMIIMIVSPWRRKTHNRSTREPPRNVAIVALALNSDTIDQYPYHRPLLPLRPMRAFVRG